MRVLVTGLGVAAPQGIGAEAFWGALGRLEAAVSEAPPAREGLQARPATVFSPALDAERHADPRRLRKSSNQVRAAAVAAVACAQDARLPDDPALRADAAVVLGTCFGSSAYYLGFHEGIRRKGLKGANSVLFTEGVFNAASGHVCQLLGLRGPGLALVGGEEVGLSAIVAGVDRVRLGSPVALCGGAEEFSDMVQASLLTEARVGERLGGAFGPAPGPFAEGAAVVCLEPEERALARGATAWAEVLGVARARAAAPDDPQAWLRAARSVLAQAGAAPGEVDLVVGGAAGGPAALRERAALEALFTDASPRYCAPKALLGEGFAFTSAAQLVVAAQALRHGVVPPTFAPPGEELPACGGLTAVAAPLGAPLRRALVVAASGPGGVAAALLGAVSAP